MTKGYVSGSLLVNTNTSDSSVAVLTCVVCVCQEVWGYQPCMWRLALVCVGALFSGGLLLLLLYWLPQWSVKSTSSKCALREARVLLLRSTVPPPLTCFFHFALETAICQKCRSYFCTNRESA